MFCVTDLMAFGALNAARFLDATVPDDVWVVGFDDIQMASWEVFGLTTVKQPIPRMAGEAVELLMRRIKDANRPPEHVRLGESRLVVRASTAHKQPLTAENG